MTQETDVPGARCASDQPIGVALQDGQVIVLSPGGTFALTAEAAERSARRLLDAAALAQGRHPTPRPS
ncbi:MAG TPA: hypothetical protein VG939_09905 [Caulobacteraceae bacterium]|nr:hypothetical protein [Caulobacteraceae bacterium]